MDPQQSAFDAKTVTFQTLDNGGPYRTRICDLYRVKVAL